MDGRGRRNRRRAYSCFSPRLRPQPWSFIDSLISIFILSGLLGVIYLMLEQHFTMCNPSCDLNNINKSLADIAKNIANMKDGYRELELQIIRFSQELPKIEGQVELIEALTYAIEKKEAGWNPRKCMPLPNVDVFLHNPPRKVAKNITCNKNDCPKRLLKSTV